jgi:proline racemase
MVECMAGEYQPTSPDAIRFLRWRFPRLDRRTGRLIIQHSNISHSAMPQPIEIPDAIRVIDSHTEGEPTRVITEGWPMPYGASMAERRDDVRQRFDHLRRAVVCEPRGHDAVVGALLTPAVSDSATCGIIFFNNGTYLGMCGHGLIGVVTTLHWLGRIKPGLHSFDTPVGPVRAELAEDGLVTIENVPAKCVALDVPVETPYGMVVGDIAWGGNWFYIFHHDAIPLTIQNTGALTRFTQAVQDAIDAKGIGKREGWDIDHIEISGPPTRADADSRNFVLCSGGQYDRSPCGTGTSAKMAVLHRRGALALGDRWRQESITGSLFTGWLTPGGNGDLIPHIQGRAFITGETILRFDRQDPFKAGFTP